MSGVDTYGPGTADAPGEDDARAQELLKGRIDRAEGLTHGQGELPQGEFPPRVRAEEPEDSHLGLGAQKILEHVSDRVPGLYRFSDYRYDFPKHPTAGEASVLAPSHRFGSPAEREQLYTVQGLPVQVASAVEDFSTHPREIGRRPIAPLRPVIADDTYIGVSEDAGDVRLDPDGPADLHGQEVI